MNEKTKPNFISGILCRGIYNKSQIITHLEKSDYYMAFVFLFCIIFNNAVYPFWGVERIVFIFSVLIRNRHY